MFFKSKCNHVVYKLEADLADPIWCADCNWNFDLEELPLSEELIKELVQWILDYKKMNEVKVSTESIKIMKAKHNEWGEKLRDKVQQELGDSISVIFVPTR
jgi:hypothetical protein